MRILFALLLTLTLPAPAAALIIIPNTTLANHCVESGATQVLGTPVPDDATAFRCVAVTAFDLPGWNYDIALFLVSQLPFGADTALTLAGDLVTFGTLSVPPLDNTADFRFFSEWIGPELSPPAATPEPGTLVLLGTSLALFGWRRGGRRVRYSGK